MLISKPCKICGEILPLDQFEKHSRMKEGLGNRCRKCGNKRVKEQGATRNKKWLETNAWEVHPTGKKICKLCNIEKSVGNFSRANYNPDGLQRECKPCQVTRFQMRHYGTSVKPGDSCHICGETRNIGIDHCHETNMVRGILCKNCNTALGGFRDKIDLLEKAISYLNRCIKTPMIRKKIQSGPTYEKTRNPIDWSKI